MKKLLILLMLLIMILSSCSVGKKTNTTDDSHKVEFVQSKYCRNENYGRTFDMMFYDSQELSLGILDGLYENETLNGVYQKVVNDYEIITNTIDVLPKTLTIYILDETVTGRAYISGDNLFCSKKDFENGMYQTALLECILDIDKTWICEGLKGVLFDEVYDEQMLTNYYSYNDDISVLRLLDTRFYNEFNIDEEIDIAIWTSISLTTFILNKYDFDVLFNDCTTDIKNEWLKTMKVERKFENEYSDYLEQIYFSTSEHYPLLAVTQDATYYIEPIEGQLDSANDIETFLYRDIKAREFLAETIESIVPDHLAVSTPSRYTYIVAESPLYSRYVNDKIYVTRMSAHAHEAVHAIFETYPHGHWTCEGIAEYLGRIVSPIEISYLSERVSVIYKKIYENVIRGEISAEDESYLEIKYYMDHGGQFVEPIAFDVRLFYDTKSYLTLFNKANFGKQPIYKIKNIAESERIPGDELTYLQAGSFTAFLVEKYSFEKFLELYLSEGDFEEVFGEPYDVLKLEWMEYLKR